MVMDRWQWTLAKRHLTGRYSRAGLQWINFFAFSGICLGVFAWITVMSVMEGLQSDIKNKILREKPHLLWEGRPTAGKIQGIEEFKQKNIRSVREVRTLIQTEGLVEREIQEGPNPASPVVIQAVDDMGPGSVQTGAELASVLSLRPGEILSIRSAWDLERFPLRLKFVGTMESGVYDMDRHLIRVLRSDLARWLQLGDAVSRIEIFLNDPYEAARLRASANQSTGLDFKTWEEVEGALLYSLRLEKNMMGFSVFFVVLLSTLALSMGMAVRMTEKRRLVGLLRGLGARTSQILGIFWAETLLLSSVAVLLGVGLSFVICWVISHWGFLPNFYYGRGVPVKWSWSTAWMLGGCVMILALLAAWLPMKRGMDVQPIEALNS
jgi:lipoprotein-releasing system permease protein